jgi:hypothetical protein
VAQDKSENQGWLSSSNSRAFYVKKKNRKVLHVVENAFFVEDGRRLNATLQERE